MAARRSDEARSNGDIGLTSRAVDRVTRLLALLVVKDEPPAAKIRLLSGAGFTNTEIARLLGMKANAVNQAVHRLRSRK